MNDSKLIQIHVFVSGRVQKVGFRITTIYQAKRTGVSGWTRNRLNGQVETVVVGSKNKIDKMLKWLARGPMLAKVEKLEIISRKEVNDDPFKKRFEKRKTI